MVKKVRPVYRRLQAQRAAAISEATAAGVSAVSSSESPSEPPVVKSPKKSNSKSK